MQEKLESSRIGRLLISAFVIVTVAALVAWNLPESKLRAEGVRLAGPYIRAAGLDQYWWTIFAPDPVRSSFVLSARATYADGTRGVWQVPVGSDAIGTYWDFRWGKWAESTIAGNIELCRGTAAYAANRLADAGGRAPVEMELVVRRRENFPPGAEPSHGPWRERMVCRVDIVTNRGTS